MNPPMSQLITMPEGKTLEFKRDISDCRNVLKMSINLRPNELWPKLGPSWDHVISKPSTQSPTQSDNPILKLLLSLQDGEKSSGELRSTLNIKHRPTFRDNYLHPALGEELIEMTIPEKPSSRLQKYRLTPKGRAFLTKEKKEENK